MKLSPHFSLSEMTLSQTAVRNGIDNRPGEAEIAALKLLCEEVLERVRRHFNRPVIISSGYRSPALNREIGGSSTSQHCKGEAADFTVPGLSNLEVCDWMHRRLNYDQLIYEYGEAGWVHCSFSADRMRNAELTAVRDLSGTRYLSGIRTA